MALRPAKWKSVNFWVDDTGAEVGRRNVLHEYPFRDVPLGEDLGRAARKVRITAFFIGDKDATAMDRAWSLINAMEAEGPGTLIHPWLGRMDSMQLATPGSVKFPRAEGGKITVQLDLIEAGESLDEDVSADTASQLQSAADTARTTSQEAIAADWLIEVGDYLDAAATQVEAACQQFEKMLEPVAQAEMALDRIINSVQRIINAPLSVAGKLEDRIERLIGKLSNPFSGLTSWGKLLKLEALHSWYPAGLKQQGGQAAWVRSAATNTTLKTGQLPAMPASMAHYVRRELVIQGVESLPSITFTSKAEIASVRQQLLVALDTEIKAAQTDDLYVVFSDLRLTVVQHLAAVLPTVADIQTITTLQTMPALVLAYQITGAIDIADDLVARNGITHPGFVPAGRVEVLING